MDRYDATRRKLRNVLERRIRLATDEEERERARALVDELLARFTESGLISDERFARHFVDAARRRGTSTRKIQQKLLERGVSSENIASQLQTSMEETGIGDQEAALTFARKRRLHQRFELGEPTARAKALASLARQGFSFDAASAALRTLEQEAEKTPP